jgi:adenylate kinase
MNKKAIFVLGPPGSGKGTQAKLLAEKLGFFHFITSAVGKEYIATHDDAETQKQVKIYGEGKLWESQWLKKVVFKKTQEIFEKYSGIVYDGSPRTLEEAEYLYDFLDKTIGEENIKILEIVVSDEETKRRLTKRLICDKNSEHVFTCSKELRAENSCPHGDGNLTERDLDKEEIINARLDEYKNKTLPGIDLLREKHSVIAINGEQSIENVFQKITEKL